MAEDEGREGLWNAVSPSLRDPSQAVGVGARSLLSVSLSQSSDYWGLSQRESRSL